MTPSNILHLPRVGLNSSPIGMSVISGLPKNPVGIAHNGHYITSDGGHYLTSDNEYYTVK